MIYIFNILVFTNIYIMLCLGANILVRWANLFSIFQAAFFGIGAYTTAVLITRWQVTAIPTLLLTILACVLASILSSLVTSRLKGDFFFLATLGLQAIILTVIKNLSITGGRNGISPIYLYVTSGIQVRGEFSFLVMSTLLVLLTLWFAKKMAGSPFLRLLKAMGSDEIALQSLGKNTRRIRLEAFAAAGVFFGVAGFVYATYMTRIDPASFDLDESVLILTAVLVGGSGKYVNSIAGALLVIVLPELLKACGLPGDNADVTRQVIFGIILIFLTRLSPRGTQFNQHE